ncbi:MAG: SDR family oxidoreductase [Alphaproteobacteria bacterium]|nr:SDR family oxidoreductase [Alphaproteobacteria bacterium]
MAECILAGKVAIVTGGGRGLGRAMVLALAEAGANVVCAAHIDTDFAEVKAAHKKLGTAGLLVTHRMDVRSSAECDGLIAATRKAFGPADILVNNAGLTFTYIWPDLYRKAEKPHFWEHKDDIIENVVGVNFLGADRLARRAVPAMLDKGWGRVINVTTKLSTMRFPWSSPYGPSKAALEQASDNWAQDVAGTGVTVNILNPGGGADTPGMADEMREKSRAMKKPMLMAPEKMMAPVVWLASPASNGVNGMRYDAQDWNEKKASASEASRIGRPVGFLLRPRKKPATKTKR